MHRHHIYPSRMRMPRGGGGTNSFKTLALSDLTVDKGQYSTLNASQSGTDIDIEFGGGNSTLDPRNFGFLEYDTGVATLPLAVPGYRWVFNLYLAFDVSGFSGNEDLNLGLYIFSDTADSTGSSGTGYFGGGLISENGGTNKTLKMYTPNRKASSALPLSSTVVAATANRMTLQCIERVINEGNVRVRQDLGLTQFGSTGGWDANFKQRTNASAVTSGSNWRAGVWMSRATNGLANVSFSITDFSFAALKWPQ
jgi:hypothetical protein